MRCKVIGFLAGCCLLISPPGSKAERVARSKPSLEPQPLAATPEAPRAPGVLADTLWFGDWGFGHTTCDSAGWTRSDHRILRDASNYWNTGSDFAGMGGISGQAAILSHSDPCWPGPGYDNDWDYSIVCKYSGAGPTLSFDYLLDSELEVDSLIVEADEHCASDARVDYAANPSGTPDRFRLDLFGDTGLVTAGNVSGLSLPDFGAPNDTHCVYIRFHSDRSLSPADGVEPSTLGAALVVDDIAITGSLAYVETFEGALHPLVSLVNSAPAEPFGLWARLHPQVTDNDVCSGVRDCAWLFSDPTLPALSPGMAFGPDASVVRNWLDNAIVSPWVSLPGAPGRTILTVRNFPGNLFSTGRIVSNWSLRTRRDLGDSECVSPWKRTGSWNSLSTFKWVDLVLDLTQYIEADAVQAQLRYRVSDWQYINGSAPPSPLDPGPGPYLDRVRLGRPADNVIHPNSLAFTAEAQDNFASELTDQDPVEDYTPSTDRLGASDFAAKYRHVGGFPRYMRTRDSLWVEVKALPGAPAITSVELHGAIVAGPHQGKSPPPWTVGPNGFFAVPADSIPWWEGGYFADLDDRYFRGGDVLYYFWSATDALGGYFCWPEGLSSPPGSIEAAASATGGLLEVSFLPAIDWDPDYLARIAADPHGKLEPTPAERAGSQQRNCILLSSYQWASRRSGDSHRTAFMYTLDRLGYRGAYDVYDQHGSGTINNALASRASVEQATGYSLIIVDAPGAWLYAIPPGNPNPFGGSAEILVEQSQWYQEWLASAVTSEAGRATLWVIQNDLPPPPVPVAAQEMTAMVVGTGVALAQLPHVVGESSFTWADGSSSNFSMDDFVLTTNQCGVGHSVNTLAAVPPGVATHRLYGASGTTDAVIMNRNVAAGWNTVLMGFKWSELANADGTPASRVTELADTILRAALADSCERAPDPATGAGDDPPGLDTAPRRTALLPSVPNPFNPVTTLHFDLARDGMVELVIHDVAGRLVRRLVHAPLARRHHEIVWDGLDEAGNRLSSGVYFARLQTVDGEWSRKLVLLR